MKKYIATVHPVGDNPFDLVPQYFKLVYLNAESEEEAEKIINEKGFGVTSIHESESDLAKTILYLDEQIDRCNESIKNGHGRYDSTYLIRRQCYEEILDVARGLS